MPDVLWKVFADPANLWMVGAMLVGLVGTVAGPWAIVRFAARQTSSDPRIEPAEGHTAREWRGFSASRLR